jgi:hypothetical protein
MLVGEPAALDTPTLPLQIVISHFHVRDGSLKDKPMRLLAAVFALPLFACAPMGDTASPSYSAGFADGCATASAEGTALPRQPQRNEALYAKERDYRAGWISGHATCRTEGRPPRL